MKGHHSRTHGESLERGVKVSCSSCGKEIRRYPFEVEDDKHYYCSDECESDHRAKFFTGEDSPAYKGAKVTKDCPNCGTENSRYKGSIDGGFCNRECYGEWLSENNSGENHPRWSGGSPRYYGSNWEQQRKRALERDGYVCQVCGMDNPTHKQEFGEALHVHHIHPIANYDKPEKANYLDNLITMCESCHHRWEGIPLKPQK
jgi:5-methylcytosine-specific restriction endonuclease McrA